MDIFPFYKQYFYRIPHCWLCENPHCVLSHHPFIPRDSTPHMHMVSCTSSICKEKTWGTLCSCSSRLLCQLTGKTPEGGYWERGFCVFFVFCFCFCFYCSLKPVLPESCPANPSLGFSHHVKRSFLMTSLGPQTLVYMDLFGKIKP